MAQTLVIMNFQTPSGAPLALGRATFQLLFDGSISDSQICAGRIVSAPLNSSGTCQVALWPTDQMQPANDVYIVRAYSASGQLAWSGEITVPTVAGP